MIFSAKTSYESLQAKRSCVFENNIAEKAKVRKYLCFVWPVHICAVFIYFFTYFYVRASVNLQFIIKIWVNFKLNTHCLRSSLLYSAIPTFAMCEICVSVFCLFVTIDMLMLNKFPFQYYYSFVDCCEKPV